MRYCMASYVDNYLLPFRSTYVMRWTFYIQSFLWSFDHMFCYLFSFICNKHISDVFLVNNSNIPIKHYGLVQTCKEKLENSKTRIRKKIKWYVIYGCLWNLIRKVKSSLSCNHITILATLTPFEKCDTNTKSTPSCI